MHSVVEDAIIRGVSTPSAAIAFNLRQHACIPEVPGMQKRIIQQTDSTAAALVALRLASVCLLHALCFPSSVIGLTA